MFLLNLLRFLRGYVWFEARGVFVERFLNLVARDHVSVWSGRKRGDVYVGCVLARNYRRLRGHAKKAGVHLRVTEKHGVPFQRRKYRGRAGLLVGICVYFLFLYGMSLFLWRIEIHGNNRVDEVVILQALASLDVEPGSLRRSVDVRDCERKMLLLVPDLSWVALNIDGSALRVEVSESILPPEMIDPGAPCNIVAKEAGQIVALNVFVGEAVVAVGDTVIPGDIVVSGITQDGRGQHLYRHANAQVIIETTQTLEIAVPLEQTKFIETGRTKKRRYLQIFGAELPLFLPLQIPSPYRIAREELPLRLFSADLPLAWLREDFILMQETRVTLTEEEAKQEAAKELENLRAARLGDAAILSSAVRESLETGQYQIQATYECRMDAALKKEILKSAPQNE